ncbi:sialate O-acetylesterase [Pontiella sulfatireligans]|uniref:Sialate O-acetylesterase domain-containing protein n=1 Tax=Pontiella sulfatireligans TaxID=2750658 RepID=A0A6C2UEG1_9BACT|nr:sialate O-acetylesterase [Pontiella sulfatireligans]VGO18602.1 hypothetical protein SCARR_00655 [Pontiella sulfatireligans]
MKLQIIFLLLFCSASAFAKVQLASVFSDHMVLQRGKPVPVWGTADPGEKVSVAFAGQKKTAAANPAGKWRLQLDPLRLSKHPQNLSVSSQVSDFKFQVSDILVGDVWICSGQSNMKFALGNTLGAEEIIPSADIANLRLLQVPKKIELQPSNEFNASWAASSPETASKFTAVGFLFGRRVQKEADIPIGLIMCAEGSTSVECWVSNKTLESDLFAPAVRKWREVEASWDDPAVRAKHLHKSLKADARVKPSDARTYPAGCYNGMLHPLFPFAIKGVVWYQGEANRLRAHQYRSLFPAMLAEWRDRFEQDDFKFYAIQLPEIGKPSVKPGGSPYAELREAQQLAAQNDPLVELAVVIDSDQGGSIHPKNKQLPGERLAAIALAKDYGQDIEFSGPVFQRLEIKSKAVRLFFGHADGLVCGKRVAPTSLEIEPTDDAPANFTVAGDDQVFHEAQAIIKGDSIIVRSDAVSKPVAVRYAWADNPAGCNLYNRASFPVRPFRTDDWPCVTKGNVEGKVLVIR